MNITTSTDKLSCEAIKQILNGDSVEISEIPDNKSSTHKCLLHFKDFATAFRCSYKIYENLTVDDGTFEMEFKFNKNFNI